MPGPHSRGAAVAAPPPAPGRGRPPAGGTSPMQSPMTSSFSVLSAWFRHTRNASASRCTACTAILPSPPACPRPAPSAHGPIAAALAGPPSQSARAPPGRAVRRAGRAVPPTAAAAAAPGFRPVLRGGRCPRRAGGGRRGRASTGRPGPVRLNPTRLGSARGPASGACGQARGGGGSGGRGTA